MAFSNQLQQLFFLLPTLLLPTAINGAFFLGQQCRQNFTDNTILKANINSTVLDLAANTAARGGFANTSFGSGNDAVYGVAECRGDVTGQPCFACIADSARQVLGTCPNSAEALIWQDSCFLGYGTNFKSQSFSIMASLWLSGNITTGRDEYRRAAGRLNAALQAEATAGGIRKFSWGEIESRDLRNNTLAIYGMAQCLWDLPSAVCGDCLSNASSTAAASCVNSSGCFVINSGCWLKSEERKFIFINAPLDPVAPASSMTVAAL